MLDDISDDFTYKFDLNAIDQSNGIGRRRPAKWRYSRKAVQPDGGELQRLGFGKPEALQRDCAAVGRQRGGAAVGVMPNPKCAQCISSPIKLFDLLS
jgi:hypothetical protein